MTKEDNSTLIVDEKCRRCGNITEWIYRDRKPEIFERILSNTIDRITTPVQSYCDICKKATVHEIVSFYEEEK